MTNNNNNWVEFVNKSIERQNQNKKDKEDLMLCVHDMKKKDVTKLKAFMRDCRVLVGKKEKILSGWVNLK